MVKYFINATDAYNKAILEANKASPSQIKKLLEDIDRNNIPVPQSVLVKLFKVWSQKCEDGKA